MSVILYAVTPISGFIKNYVKYKRVNVAIFARTPLTYLVIDRILSYYRMKNIVLWTIIFERWFFFYLKIIQSYFGDCYRVKQKKYEKKYNLVYPTPSTSSSQAKRLPSLPEEAERSDSD
jgi:hypothetical protein